MVLTRTTTPQRRDLGRLRNDLTRGGGRVPRRVLDNPIGQDVQDGDAPSRRLSKLLMGLQDSYGLVPGAHNVIHVEEVRAQLRDDEHAGGREDVVEAVP